MIRIISNEKRYDEIFIRYLGKDYPIKYGSKVYIRNAELTSVDLRFFTNGYNLEYSCDSTDIPKGLDNVFGPDRVKSWLNIDYDFQSELKRAFGTARIPFGIIDKNNNIIYPAPVPTGDSYNKLDDKPRINGVALYGDKSADQLGLITKEEFAKIVDKMDVAYTANIATQKFINENCVTKDSVKLLTSSERTLINTISELLAQGDNNSLIDKETLEKSYLSLYVSTAALNNRLSAYVSNSLFDTEKDTIYSRITALENSTNSLGSQITGKASYEYVNNELTRFATNINGVQVINGTATIYGSDICITSDTSTTIAQKFLSIDSSIDNRIQDVTARININAANIQNNTIRISSIENSISNIGNGITIVDKAYHDRLGNPIDTSYVLNATLTSNYYTKSQVDDIVARLTRRIEELERANS